MIAGMGLVAGLVASRFLKASAERRYGGSAQPDGGSTRHDVLPPSAGARPADEPLARESSRNAWALEGARGDRDLQSVRVEHLDDTSSLFQVRLEIARRTGLGELDPHRRRLRHSDQRPLLRHLLSRTGRSRRAHASPPPPTRRLASRCWQPQSRIRSAGFASILPAAFPKVPERVVEIFGPYPLDRRRS
jgi:hypothetical protein